MAQISCFSFLLGGKTKRSKLKSKVPCSKKATTTTGTESRQKVKPVEFMNMADSTVDVISEGGGGDDAPARDTNAFVVHPAAESGRRERDANGDKASSRRHSSNAGDDDSFFGYGSGGDDSKKAVLSAEPPPDAGEAFSVGGRVSPTASPELKRSCSNIETVRSVVPAEQEFDVPAKSRSYGGELKVLPSGRLTTTPIGGGAPDASPTASVRTSCSADRVMLKKRSSGQVLPSRSRKLWWRLILWSHRNLHRRPGTSFTVPALPPADDTYAAPHRNDDGYTSDTLDAVTAAATAAREPNKNKDEVAVEAGPIPNQWVAFPSETTTLSLDRVSAWVNSLGNVDEEDNVTERDDDDGAVRRAWCSDEIVECSTAAEKRTRAKRRTAEEAVVQANSSMVQTLNTASSVARISSMGLQAVPMIAAFSSLRAVNLSDNFIVDIYPGSLPKGLHSLDLSRNKIASIEQGLRELTRLRVLNLSYNRISRIGHGLSSCTAIRELYLAGNRIGDVEGLHRLLKLAVLDVSFNKITTTKSLGQLVASYGSLRALNLLGNPVQANVGDDTLRKAVSGLLPRLEYLNKKAVKPQQRGREVGKDSVVARAALGNSSGWGARSRRTSRRVSQSPGGSPGKKSRGSSSRSRSKTRAQGSSPSRR